MTDYKLLCRQLEIFAEEDPGFVPLLSNASALLWEALPDINWAGFYLVMKKDVAEDDDGSDPRLTAGSDPAASDASALRLVLGPFQGKPACIHIAVGKGVCGTAVAEDKLQLVPDVHQFPGHIACDSASESEIVVPIHHNGEIVAVLDIDSPIKERFDETDAEGLQKFVQIIEENISWE